MQKIIKETYQIATMLQEIVKKAYRIAAITQELYNRKKVDEFRAFTICVV